MPLAVHHSTLRHNRLQPSPLLIIFNMTATSAGACVCSHLPLVAGIIIIPIYTADNPMEQIGFRMQLNDGQAQEYRRRHDEIWPELASLLKKSGISDYSIFLHENSNSLFAVLRRSPDHTMSDLPLEPVMQRWWAYMADIMATYDSNEPVIEPLERVFHLA